MGQRKQLSSEERAQIDIIKRTHPDWTQKKIAQTIGRSPDTIGRYLKDPQNYGRKARSGRPRKTSIREDRLIVQKARTGTFTLNQIKSDLELNCSKTTVWNRLDRDEFTRYGPHKCKPPLTDTHKAKRLNWAISHVSQSDDFWANIIWSDEKKWNLDGPDGCKSHWYDLRKEKKIFSKRHSGGGSVMTWAGFSSAGCTEIAFTTARLNAARYQDILEEYLIPTAPLITNGKWTFMQDNAPSHRAESTRAFLSANEVDVIEWPPYSPDLNPIENLWGWLVRKVYEHGRQFVTKEDLKRTIVNEWAKIPSELTKSLSESLRNRLIKVFQKKGASIDY